jgi:hypothetical protein
VAKKETVKEVLPPLHFSIKNVKGETPVIHTKFQFIVWNMVTCPERCNWGNEIKLAKKLYDLFPDLNFWSTMYERKYPTLVIPAMTKEIENIKNKYAMWKSPALEITQQTQYNIGKEKVGEDKQFKPTQQTLLDFLNKKK